MLALTLAISGGLATPQTALAAPGGPVILGGDDLTDHGSRNTSTNTNVAGWLYLEKAIENVLPSVTRTGNNGSIAALGSADSTGTFGADAGAAMHWAAQDAGSGVPVTYYNGETAINGFFSALTAGTTNPAIIWIAGNGAGNDLASGPGNEPAALTNNATAIGDFVNSGGGLISHGSSYGWLSALLPGATAPFSGGSGDLVLTAAGTSAFPGLTNQDINAGPWHNHFEGNLGGLQVLAASNFLNDNTGADAPVIIGGAAVTLPGSITLEPGSDTNPVGTQHTVTATVRNNQGVVQSGVTVNFLITAGPNMGDSGSGTTNASGQTTFTWTGNSGAGTDTVQASFVDETGTTRTTTATKTWEAATTSADLSISKADAPDPVEAGQELIYTIIVNNGGPDPAEMVRVTDTLPSTVTFGSAGASQGTCTVMTTTVTTVTCELGTIASGGMATVTIKVTPTTQGTITNTASVSSTTTDPDPTNNSDTETTVVDPAVPRCNGLVATFVGGDGNDYIQTGPGDDVIVDSGGDNYVQTNGGDDHICLGDGNDEVDSGDGDDFVDAGDGKNKIKTGNGSDTVRSGTGDDDIDTGDGDDIVMDTGGKNKIFTGNGRDRVNSGSGDDEIETGNGDDVVLDSGGNNTVKTGDGDDHITTGDGRDKIDGGNGFDTCSPGGGSNKLKDCEA